MTLLKKYSDLLPQYLRGPNIARHAEIIEAQDKKVYEKIELLRLWNIPERPVLIQRLQTQPGLASIIVHVNSPYPVQKLTIEREGSTDIVLEYEEDELKTQFTYSYTQQGTDTVITPMCTVTVETYEGITYKKGYPENVEVQGDVCDHDEFLDLLGKLLGLPRRRYKEVTISQDSQYSQLVPAYFLGSLEDDYYYAERLRHLMDNYQTSELLPLMGELLYEMHNPLLFNLIGRTTVTEETEDYLGENVMALGLQTQYLNIDYSNIVEVLSQYMNLTRLLIFVHSAVSRLSFVEVGDSYPNYLPITSVLEYSYDNSTWLPLEGAPVKATLPLDGKVMWDTRLTDDNGEVYNSIGGLPPGSYSGTFEVEYDEPYEISGSNYETNVSFTVGTNADISTDSWKYAKYQSTSASSITAPSMEGALLDAGLGCACYTPIISSPYIDDVFDAYTISCDFYFTGGTQFIALARISGKGGDNTIAVTKDRTRIYPSQYEAHDSSISTQHNVTWKILNKICYLYYDGIYTGIHHDYSSGVSGHLNVCAYNVRAITSGVKIESVTVDDSVDLTDAPVGQLLVLDTWNSEKWSTKQGSSGPYVAPAVSSGTYNLGRNTFSIFKDYTVNSSTVNKVIEIEFNTQTTIGFRLGFGRESSTGVSQYTSYFNATNDATVTTGTHILEFRCDEYGVWRTYLDGTQTSTSEFTIDNTREVYGVDYLEDNVVLLGIRAYDEYISGETRTGTSISVQTTGSTVGSAGLQATLLDEDSNALSGVTLTCKNGSTTVATGTTDSNGVATLNLSSLSADTYSLTVEYAGDPTYAPSTTTHSITIQKLATSLSVTTVSSQAGSASLSATLSSDGTGISGASILCKNGGTTIDTATTNSSGVASLDLSSLTADTYTLTIKYDGDSTYAGTSTTHTITITDSVVITDDCTTLTNWNVSDTRTMPTITTVANKTGVTPTSNAYARTFWKYPLVRGANTTISFKFYTTDSGTNASLAVLSLKTASPQDAYAIRQYVGGWRAWGTENGSDKQGTTISTSTWHDITYSLSGNTLQIYVDDTLRCTQTIGTIDSNPYFNDYFFLGHGRWSTASFVITDIEYTSDTVVSDSTIASIVAAHQAQF